MSRAAAAFLTASLALPFLAVPTLLEAPASAAENDRLGRGIELARQGRLPEAIAELRRHVAAAPADADGHFWLGRALIEKGLAEGTPSLEGLGELERSLELDPSRDEARTILVQAYGLRQPGLFRPDRALEIYEELLSRHPDNLEIPLAMARWLLFSEIRLARRVQGRVLQDSAWGTRRATVLLEEVLRRAPAHSTHALRARALIADAQFRAGAWEEALESFRFLAEEAEKRSVPAARLHNLIGHVEWRRGDSAKAALAFRRACELEATPRYLYDLAIAYRDLGGYPADLPERLRFPFREEVVPTPPPALSFEDVAPTLGIDKLGGAGPSGWADYNLDGRFDLVVCGVNVFCSLYRNEGNRFSAVEEEVGLHELEPGFGTAWADYDNDGDPDLYISRNGWNGPAPNSLLRNNGDGTFTDVARSAGVDQGGSSFHSAWVDYDRDGWLDLVVSGGVYLEGTANVLYRNLGDGTFRDVTSQVGMAEPSGFGTIGVAIGDYDDDGWPDIFFHGRMTWNRLYRNQGDGTFRDEAAAAGVAGSGEQNGYVALMADLDSDGDLDIFTGSLAEWDEVIAGYRSGYRPGPTRNIPRFYRNRGDGTFSDDSLAVGLRYPLGIMAGTAADLDNDGFLDLYLGTGNPDLARLEPNIFYSNRGGRRFEDLTRFTGLGALGKGHGTTFLDWDLDGDLEMFAELGGFYHGDLSRSAFFLNRAGNRNNWLSIELRQPELNRFAIGGRVTLEAGDWRQTQEVTASRGFSSTDPPQLHFGLGRASTIDRLIIRWPDGVSEIRRGVDANQSLRFHREGESGGSPEGQRLSGEE